MKKLLLIDGSSYLYRAFHALPDFRNPQGDPTGAIYGVVNMLRRIIDQMQCDYIACIFDAKGKTFRDEIYAEYKANRPSMPDDLVRQIEPLHRCIKALGIPLISISGVEADDVIATLTEKGTEQSLEVIISTGDKDIAQLIQPNVRLINTMTEETLDREGVKKKFGVYPEQMIDFQTLVGDTVDNVPGVEKVGPKTAAKWLDQYGNLDEILRNAGDIKGKVGENLRTAIEWLPRTKALVTLKKDVTLDFSIGDLVKKTESKDELKELFTALNFKTWLANLEKQQTDTPAKTPTSQAPSQKDYELVLTTDQLDLWIKRISDATLTCIDTETTGLDYMTARLVGVSLSVQAGHAAYIPIGHMYSGCPDQINEETLLSKLRPWLEDPKHKKVGQNLKFDLHIFRNHGIDVKGVAHDTLLQSYVLESHLKHDMDSLAERHLGIRTTTYDDVTGTGVSRIPFSQVPLDVATNYAAEDADITLQLHEKLWSEVSKNESLNRIYASIEIPTMLALFEIERQGVLIDSESLHSQTKELSEKICVIEEEAFKDAGEKFNLSSPKQLQEILFTKKNLPVIKKTPGGQPSTNEEVLQQLALDHPLPKLILEHRSLSKLKSTYTEKLPKMVLEESGRIHTNYAQAVAITGRLASNDPNLQNIPIRTPEGRHVREAFVAPPGHIIVSADYSQIELRIMAHLSDDKGLIRAFKEGADIHRETASELFGITTLEVSNEQRRYAKIINFGLIYGMSAFGLARQMGIERNAAQQYIDRYFSRYPGVAKYMEKARENAARDGYVETVFGRKLTLPEIHSSNHQRRQAAERAAINAPMQGTAADLIKLAMIRVNDWLHAEGLSSRIIMQVHDELVLETPDTEAETILKNIPVLMAGVAELRVPLLAEVGSGLNWDTAH